MDVSFPGKSVHRLCCPVRKLFRRSLSTCGKVRIMVRRKVVVWNGRWVPVSCFANRWAGLLPQWGLWNEVWRHTCGRQHTNRATRAPPPSRTTPSARAIGKGMGHSKRNKAGRGEKAQTPLPSSGKASAASSPTAVVVGEGKEGSTTSPPKSKINKSGWKFKNYNRGASGTHTHWS